MTTCKFTTVLMPEANNQQIAGHLCDRCIRLKMVGDGGQDDASGQWEYYWQGCGVQMDKSGYHFPRCVILSGMDLTKMGIRKSSPSAIPFCTCCCLD